MIPPSWLSVFADLAAGNEEFDVEARPSPGRYVGGQVPVGATAAMNHSDPRWYKLRNLVFEEAFANADALVASDPSLLHARNGLGETVLHFLAVEDDLAGVAWLHAKGEVQGGR